MRHNVNLNIFVVCAFLTNFSSANGQNNVLPVAPGDVPTPCTPDDDTSSSSICGPDRYCALDPNYSSNAEYYCLHKTLAHNPVSGRDVIALLLIAGCCFLAAMGGIGGGGLLFPLIVMVMNFTPKEAIVLSHAGVFGNCLGQASFYITNAFWARRQRSQGDADDDRTDDDSLYRTVSAAVLVILPGLLAGGSTALTLQGLVPSTAILILALLTLSLGVVKTTMKAIKMWKEEEDAALGQAGLMSSSADENENADFEEDGDDSETAFQYKAMDSRVTEPDDNNVASEEDEGTQQNDIDEEFQESKCCRGIFRCTVEKLIFLCWILDATTFLAQKSSSIAKCSAPYFVVVFLPVFIGIIFIWRGRILLTHHREVEQAIADQINETGQQDTPGEDGDVWADNMRTASTTLTNSQSVSSEFDVLVWWLPLAAFIVGLISALLGIGGGEILGPTLLLLNMNPLHSSTTTSVVALLNSGTNTLHNFTAGLIISPGYFASIWSVGLIAGGSGRAFSMILSKRSGKNSIIAFSLSALLGIATALVVIELVRSPPEWESEGVC